MAAEPVRFRPFDSPGVAVEGFSAGLATPLKETTLAVLFRITDVGDEWIPKKCIHEDSEVWKEGQEEGELVVTLWFAEKKGWA